MKVSISDEANFSHATFSQRGEQRARYRKHSVTSFLPSLPINFARNRYLNLQTNPFIIPAVESSITVVCNGLRQYTANREYPQFQRSAEQQRVKRGESPSTHAAQLSPAKQGYLFRTGTNR